MEEAETFLGRPYFLSGHVVHGRELGRTIQVPTANLLPKHGKIYPVTGVYASRIHLEDGRVCYGITNIGDNPTVNTDRRVTIETHIFDLMRISMNRSWSWNCYPLFAESRNFQVFQN